MSVEKFYVQIDRTDGSRNYKGPWTREHSQREADAWSDSFPGYGVSLVWASDDLVRRDVRAWQRHVNHSQEPYFPVGERGEVVR